MGILSRFKDIIGANINALIEKAENPAKLIDKYLIDAKEDLAEVKKQTAGVMAEEKKAKRLVDEKKAEMDKYTTYAKKAVLAGNDGDAKVFLAKKQQIETELAPLNVAYTAAHENSVKMTQLYNKLTADIQTLETKKAAIKAKVSVAETQQTINKYTSSADKFNDTMSAFGRMEEKANRMLDEATSMAELDMEPIDEAKALEQKYQQGGTNAAVDDELEALKKSMGMDDDLDAFKKSMGL